MAILVVIINLILYLAFGSIVTLRKNKKFSVSIAMVTGFFAYYALFSLVCLPIMLTYRPLSLLTTIWSIVVIVVLVIAVICSLRAYKTKFVELKQAVLRDKALWGTFAVVTIVMVVAVVTTYNFTLDAAYYVANVSTSVDTNMINVYDPFTGAWQDHFELRYAFATYSVYDAVVCMITKLPALVVTKTVMSATVMIIVCILDMWIAGFLCKGNAKQRSIMFIAMMFINVTFISLYTTGNFLMTRTYEGKSIVGNIAVVAIFAMYMIAVREGTDFRYYLTLFVICLGTATVSSTANMVIPAEIGILFMPYIIKHKKPSMIIKLGICVLPELIMMLMYVLYVKGYFAIYTYPRY